MKSDKRPLQKKALIVTSEKKLKITSIFVKNSNVSLLLVNYSEFTIAWMYKWEGNLKDSGSNSSNMYNL